MYCKYCGKEISDSASFCRYCGKETQNTSRRTVDRNVVNNGRENTEKEKKSSRSPSATSSRSSGGKYARYEKKDKQSPRFSRIIWRFVWIVLLICCASYSLNPDNNILGINGMRKAYATAQEVIQNELLSPNSAVFPEFEPEFVTQRTKSVTHEGIEFKVYTVTAYVDSNNAFGASVRSKFVVEIGFPTEGDSDVYYYNIISLS